MSEDRSIQEDAQAEVNSDEASQQPSQDDVIKNLKAEFGRKFENLSQSNERMEALIAQLAESRSEKAQVPQQDLGDLIYEDPDKALREMEARITKTAEQKISQRVERQQKTQQTVATFQSKYPELQDEGHPAYKAALKSFETLPEHLKGTPEGAQMAILQAVADFGLQPKQRRKGGTDNFSVSSKAGAQGSKGSAPKEDRRMLAFAEAMGLDVQDKKVVERLSKTGERNFKEWN